ncbi:TPA: hypothetical protein PXO92_002509 [Yersinia enterocolitica]|nr:hypothetical protein [Yersinia enterocolitica]
MGREEYYVVNVLIPAMERYGFTIKTNYGEVKINPRSPAVKNFLNGLREELSHQQSTQTPYMPF